MPDESPYDRATSAFARFKREMKERFPSDHLVAIAGGRFVANAPSIEELEGRLKGVGFRLDQVFINQVGDERELIHEYPGWIIANAIIEHTLACLTPPASDTPV
jgi:hypothetical protein